MSAAEKEKKPDASAAKPEAEGEPVEKTAKKRKLLIIGGIAGLLVLCLGVGGFLVAKTLMAPKVEVAAKGDATEGHEKGADGKAADGKAADGKAADGKAADGKAADGKAADAKGADGKDADGKAADGKGADGKAADGKAADGKPAESSGGKTDSSAKSTGEGAGDKDTRERSNDIGEAYEFPKMDLNLGNPLENRFLRMGLSIDYHGGEKQKEDIKKREPILKDIVISAVSSKSRIDLLSEKGKEKLRRELTNRFNEVLERPIKAIYFTDFLVE